MISFLTSNAAVLISKDWQLFNSSQDKEWRSSSIALVRTWVEEKPLGPGPSAQLRLRCLTGPYEFLSIIVFIKN